MAQLVDLYEVDTESAEVNQEIWYRVQSDWCLLSADDVGLVRQFLEEALGEPTSLLFDEAPVRLKGEGDSHASSHLVSWDEFSAEICYRNRYFLSNTPDGQILTDSLKACVETAEAGVRFFRSRVLAHDQTISAEQMGAPPPSRANPGRANPSGIPYLYLAYDADTAIHEARVVSQSKVAIGEFVSQRDVHLVNLADIPSPDFFTTDDPLGSVQSYRFLQVLGQELSKPISSEIEPVYYVPTQYLCEFVKSLEFDGVIYPSAMFAGGRNLVLFDHNSVECQPDVRTIEVTSISAEWQDI